MSHYVPFRRVTFRLHWAKSLEPLGKEAPPTHRLKGVTVIRTLQRKKDKRSSERMFWARMGFGSSRQSWGRENNRFYSPRMNKHDWTQQSAQRRLNTKHRETVSNLYVPCSWSLGIHFQVSLRNYTKSSPCFCHCPALVSPSPHTAGSITLLQHFYSPRFLSNKAEIDQWATRGRLIYEM